MIPKLQSSISLLFVVLKVFWMTMGTIQEIFLLNCSNYKTKSNKYLKKNFFSKDIYKKKKSILVVNKNFKIAYLTVFWFIKVGVHEKFTL